MPSSKANHYGTECEYFAAEKYGLELARASWKDADFKNGTPVEIKSTMRTHSDGQPGNFKLYSKYHRHLRRHDGQYVFVVYRLKRGRVDPLRTKLIHSSQLPRLSWHGGGDHRDAKQAKLGISEVFG